MRDSMTLGSYSKIKECKCNTMQKGKKNEFVSSLLAKQIY